MFIKGLNLQGAGWDKKNSCLIEASPMQLVCPIPTIHFKPVENKRKTSKGMHMYAHNINRFTVRGISNLLIYVYVGSMMIRTIFY